MKILTKILLITLSMFVAITGCTKSNANDEAMACTLEIKPAAFINFNIVEISTGRDLFFSADAIYQISQLCFLRKKGTMYTDTVRPEIIGTGAARYFKMNLPNLQLKDTVLIKLPVSPESLPADVLAYTIKKSDDKCPQYVLDKAFFNNEEIVPTNGKFIIKKMRTVTNN